MSRIISNSRNLIDSRDVIERIHELQSDHDDVKDHGDDALAKWNDDSAEELKILLALQSAAEHYGDWQYGATLIHDSYFEAYARDLAEDIGAISRDSEWPLAYIDWEAAANALKMDYASVDFDGVTYWIRA